MITLKTLINASEQEVFDQIAVHLLTQNEKSVDEDDTYCMYHSKSGLKCAAGCLIADDEYKPEFENNGWNTLSVPSFHSDLINSMQTLHDDVDVSSWNEALIKLAHQYVLDIDIKIFGAE